MASIYHYLCQTQIVWEQLNFSRAETVAVSEIWTANKDKFDVPISIHQQVIKQDLSKWLHQTGGTYIRTDDTIERRCVFRMVRVLRDAKSRITDVDGGLFEDISVAFRHQLAQKYCETQYAGIGSIIDEDTSGEVYFLCTHPKLAVTWSQDAETGVTSVICLTDRSKLNILQDLVGSRFIQDLTHLRTMPALMCALMISKEVDVKKGNVRKLVRQVEVRTGYHEWTLRAEDSAQGDLVEMSARMSGCGIRIESNTRPLALNVELGQFLRENMEEGNDANSRDKLLPLIRVIERRTAMQVLDLKYIQSRIRTQKEAVSSPPVTHFVY